MRRRTIFFYNGVSGHLCMAHEWLDIRQKQLNATQSRQNHVYLAFSSQKTGTMWCWPITGILACDLYLILECTCFSHKSDVIYLFLATMLTRNTFFWQNSLHFCGVRRTRWKFYFEVFPMGFVVEATRNSIGDVEADVSSSQTGLWPKSKGHTIALTWVTKMKSFSYGESLNVVQPTPPTTHQHFSMKRYASAQTHARWVGGYRSMGVGQPVLSEENNTSVTKTIPPKYR